MDINNQIKKSRRGYLYQDKYALYLFLTEFIASNIVEFYVDHPYNKVGNSLDIKIVHSLDKKIESIYEVKARDKVKLGDPKVVGEAVLSLYNYPNKDDWRTNKYLITEPEIESNMMNLWSKLDYINTKNRTGGNSKKFDKMVRELRKELNMNKDAGGGQIYKNDFVKFVKQLKIKLGNSAIFDELKFTEIDNVIIKKIDNIASQIAKCKVGSDLLHDETLYYVLMHEIAKGASDLKCGNLTDILIDTMAEFFTRRILFKKSYTDSIISKNKNGLVLTFKNHLGIAKSDEGAPRVSGQTEGGVIT